MTRRNLRFVAGVEEDQWVQIAVACVKNIADLEAVLRADFIDAADGGGKFGAGDDAILHVIGRGEAANGAESVLRPFQSRSRSLASRATRTSRA